jgi:hypothetical protein
MENSRTTVLVSSHVDVTDRDKFAERARDNGRSIAGELRFMIREAIASLKAAEQR